LQTFGIKPVNAAQNFIKEAGFCGHNGLITDAISLEPLFLFKIAVSCRGGKDG
jgi:hypothetical protein